MLLTVLTMVLLTDPPEPSVCTLTGKVSLISFGKRVEPLTSSVVVYVEEVNEKTYTAAPREKQRMLQKGRRFLPPVAVLIKGEDLTFTNQDKFKHSVFSRSPLGGFTLPTSDDGRTGAFTFNYPAHVHIQCDIHPEMSAEVLVLQNPFYAMVQPDGTWTIDGLPWRDREYRVHGWEPHGGTEETRLSVKCGPAGVRPLTLTIKESPRQTPLHNNGQEFDESYPDLRP